MYFENGNKCFNVSKVLRVEEVYEYSDDDRSLMSDNARGSEVERKESATEYDSSSYRTDDNKLSIDITSESDCSPNKKKKKKSKHHNKHSKHDKISKKKDIKESVRENKALAKVPKSITKKSKTVRKNKMSDEKKAAIEALSAATAQTLNVSFTFFCKPFFFTLYIF